MFSSGQNVRFVSQVAGRVRTNTDMVVNKKVSENPDCVWVEFATLPALDNLRLVPVSMLESAE